MRIGLDARTIYAPQRRGIGKSLLRLYQHLPEVRPDWRVVAYHRDPAPDPTLLADIAGYVEPRHIDIPGDRFDAWQRLRLPAASRLDRVDALHCPANSCPGWLAAPTVVTIHDLIPIDLPETLPPAEARRFEKQVVQACRRGSVITCPSIYTCRRLMRDLHVDAERVHVMPWGADASGLMTTDEHLDEVAGRFRVRRPFAIHFGAADPRKNTRHVIEAWAMLPEKIKRQWQLLVVGLDAAMQAALLSDCQTLGIADSVVLHGFAQEADVPLLLAAAEAMIYPSRSEGFGLPILEAFAARTAVLTSDRTSLPEVAGDAAVLVDPDDMVSLVTGMTRLLRDSSLRADLVLRGSKRLSQYSWRQCAERFARAIESVVESTRTTRAAA
jgi:glycosyltransferase involved in cell wall biosynthesis